MIDAQLRFYELTFADHLWTDLSVSSAVTLFQSQASNVINMSGYTVAN